MTENNALKIGIEKRHDKILFYHKIFILTRTFSLHIFLPFGIGCFISNFLLKKNNISIIVGISCLFMTWLGWMDI